MGFRARVYLQRPGQTLAVYLNEIELDLHPVRNGRTSFTYGEKTEVGHVVSVTPPDSDRTGAIPSVYVVQSPGKRKKGEPMTDDNASLRREFIADATQMVISLARRCRNLNAAAAQRTLDEAEVRLAKEYQQQGLAVEKASELAREIIAHARGLVFASTQAKAATRADKA